MKQSVSNKKKSTPVEPVIISRLQRQTAAEIARAQARAAWRRRATRILLTAVMAAIGLRVLTSAAEPILAAYRSARAIDGLRAQLHAEMQRHERLKSKIAFLQSDHGVEEEARRLGWTKVGEVALQFVTPEPGPMATAPVATGKEPPPDKLSGSERFRRMLTRWFEGEKSPKHTAISRAP